MNTYAYERVSRRWPCGACGRDHWCRHLLRDGQHFGELCNRVASDCPAKGEGGGWLHRTLTSGLSNGMRPVPDGDDRTKLPPAELALIDRQCRSALSSERLNALAERLQVSVHSLSRLGVGYAIERGAYTFPMCDAEGRIVGLRTRRADGSKRCWPGSRLGLIVPGTITKHNVANAPDLLIVTEGESDAAAALDLGFDAIARPGCGACTALVIEYIAWLGSRRMVLIADADAPGQRGADALARRIAASGIGCDLLTLPGAKDLREWKAQPDNDCHALLALIDLPADDAVQEKDCL